MEKKERDSLPPRVDLDKKYGFKGHLKRVSAGEDPTREACLIAAAHRHTYEDIDPDSVLEDIAGRFDEAGYPVDRNPVGAILRGEIRFEWDDTPHDGDPIISLLSEVETVPIRWLWPDRIPLGTEPGLVLERRATALRSLVRRDGVVVLVAARPGYGGGLNE